MSFVLFSDQYNSCQGRKVIVGPASQDSELRPHTWTNEAQCNSIQPCHAASLAAPTLTVLRLGDLNNPVMHQRADFSALYGGAGLIHKKRTENEPRIPQETAAPFQTGIGLYKRKPRSFEKESFEENSDLIALCTPPHLNIPTHEVYISLISTSSTAASRNCPLLVHRRASR